MGVITPNSLERTEISSFRFVGAFLGGLLVQTTTLYLVKYFGSGNEATGWQWTMSCFSALAVALFLLTFASTKERVHPPKQQKNKFNQDLRDLFINKPWLLIAGATVFQLTFIVMRNSSIPYYFKYYVMEQQLNFFGNMINLSIEGFTSSFLLVGSISMIIGVILTKWISKILDKKTTYAGFLGGSAILSAFFYFVQPHNVLMIYLFNIVISFLLGPVSVLQWAIYTDTADYGEWKFNRRATALIMAASLFALKLGVTFGGAIVGWTLAYFGFVANQAQTPEAMEGILLLISVFPAIAGVIGGALLLPYSLNNTMMVKIEEELTARREANKNE
jgi:GPH family glycoside/pentoside/hexuronide:cation symporter